MSTSMQSVQPAHDTLPVSLHVLYSDQGWFVGAVDEDGQPFFRGSEYYETPERARAALPASVC